MLVLVLHLSENMCIKDFAHFTEVGAVEIVAVVGCQPFLLWCGVEYYNPFSITKGTTIVSTSSEWCLCANRRHYVCRGKVSTAC